MTNHQSTDCCGPEHYEYEVWQGDVLQAGGREVDYDSAKSEANHYAMMYIQDGPVEVRIYEKHLLSAYQQEAGIEPLLDSLIRAAYDDGDNEREEFSERVKAARASVVAYVQSINAGDRHPAEGGARTADIELQPLPDWMECLGEISEEDIRDYARANIEHATARLQAENERLAEALRRYGVHDQECVEANIPICTCGLDAALAQEDRND